ncbi:hypothetical protein D3C76_1479240 [compost metagenome]
MADDQADTLAGRRQALDQAVHAQVSTVLERHQGTEKNHPDEEPARQLLRHTDARVEGIAQHHIAEHQHDHRDHAQHNQQLQQLEIQIDDFCHFEELRGLSSADIPLAR